MAVMPSGKVLTERPSFALEIRLKRVLARAARTSTGKVVGNAKKVFFFGGSLDVDVVSWMWFLGVMISFRFKMDVDFKLGRYQYRSNTGPGPLTR